MSSNANTADAVRPRTALQLDPTRELPGPLRALARRWLGIDALEALHASLPAGLDPRRFSAAVLERMSIRVTTRRMANPDEVARPGPVVYVCNHPHGGLDGLVAIAELAALRGDLRVLANFELKAIPELAPIVLPLDPYGRRSARLRNAASVRRALSWLRDGGSLLIFPAGEVARLDVARRRVVDPVWHVSIARLVRLAGADVVPLHLSGANGPLFQCLSLIHPMLTTGLLGREMLARRGSTIALRIGRRLEARRLSAIRRDEELIAHLRLHSDLLARDPVVDVPGREAAREPTLAAESSAQDAEAVATEIEALPRNCLLAESGALQVWCAPPGTLQVAMQEIGRLREVTFRAVGEGTGNAIDLDLYDNYYEQLVLWDTAARRIAGGYRIGRMDEIRRRYGKRGLYTHTLFDYREPLLGMLGATLELGRSYVRPEYQRSYAPLLLLWRGIGEYVGRNPEYCRLLGPVSISADYRNVSQELMVDYLRTTCSDPLMSTFVQARRPFRGRHTFNALGPNAALLGGMDGVSSMVAELEPDLKGVPVLLRQYLKLGGRILGFNVDPQFGDAIDCLLLVDLRNTDTAVLRKYMSATSLARFRSRHRAAGRLIGSRPV